MLEQKNSYYNSEIKMVVMGTSTGGPSALAKILGVLNAINIPLIIVQHLPSDYPSSIPERIEKLTGIPGMPQAIFDENIYDDILSPEKIGLLLAKSMTFTNGEKL